MNIPYTWLAKKLINKSNIRQMDYSKKKTFNQQKCAYYRVIFKMSTQNTVLFHCYINKLILYFIRKCNNIFQYHIPAFCVWKNELLYFRLFNVCIIEGCKKCTYGRPQIQHTQKKWLGWNWYTVKPSHYNFNVVNLSLIYLFDKLVRLHKYRYAWTEDLSQ